VLGQCRELAHLDLSGLNNQIGDAGAESLSGVLVHCAALVHLNLCSHFIGAGGAERLAGVLAPCTARAHLNLSWNAITIISELLGEGGFELRGEVKPVALFYRHLVQLAIYHLFSRQATRKSDILYTYRVVAFGLALSI
jgi:hypothetical protein